MRGPSLHAAGRIAAATGARLLGETFPARHERGAGLPAVDRLAYLAEFAAQQLGDPPPHSRRRPLPRLVLRLSRRARLAGPRRLRRPGPGQPGDDVTGALAAMAVWSRTAPRVGRVRGPARRAAGLPGGALTAETAATDIGALLPEGAIVSDESVTSGLFGRARRGNPHAGSR